MLFKDAAGSHFCDEEATLCIISDLSQVYELCPTTLALSSTLARA